MKDLLETAKTAAIAAGRVHEKYFEKALEIGEKSGSNDLVTNADFESEAKIVSVIRDVFPGHNILGEEEKYEITDSEYTWIVDPLDGTTKRVLATISGNYPLDEKSIENNIFIKPKLKADSGQLQNKDYSYSMSLSDDRMEAYIVSEPIGMPAENTTMEIIIQPGIVSVYGGRKISKEISYSVTVPGASSYVKVNSITHQLVKNDQLEYEQVFIINTKDI
jgi:hypothetical protein